MGFPTRIRELFRCVRFRSFPTRCVVDESSRTRFRPFRKIFSSAPSITTGESGRFQCSPESRTGSKSSPSRAFQPFEPTLSPDEPRSSKCSGPTENPSRTLRWLPAAKWKSLFRRRSPDRCPSFRFRRNPSSKSIVSAPNSAIRTWHSKRTGPSRMLKNVSEPTDRPRNSAPLSFPPPFPHE